ncbi:MAG: hypothetical protein LBJ10_09110 [Clostridiales bacterium]|nr:hypothetical protein [Clostridiales bacterium]
MRFDDGATVAKKLMEKYGIKDEARARFLLQNAAVMHDFGYPISKGEGLGKVAHWVAGADLVNYGKVKYGNRIKL